MGFTSTPRPARARPRRRRLRGREPRRVILGMTREAAITVALAAAAAAVAFLAIMAMHGGRHRVTVAPVATTVPASPSRQP